MSKQGSCGKCFREQDMTDEAGVAEIEGGLYDLTLPSRFRFTIYLKVEVGG